MSTIIYLDAVFSHWPVTVLNASAVSPNMECTDYTQWCAECLKEFIRNLCWTRQHIITCLSVDFSNRVLQYAFQKNSRQQQKMQYLHKTKNNVTMYIINELLSQDLRTYFKHQTAKISENGFSFKQTSEILPSLMTIIWSTWGRKWTPWVTSKRVYKDKQ